MKDNFWDEWNENPKNFPFTYEGKELWYSRSMCTLLIPFVDKDNKLYVLANKRGHGTPDFQGYWNCPCGYLDYNEDIRDCAVREAYEETGIKIDKDAINLFGINSDPNDSKTQNVTFRFYTVIEWNEDMKFSDEHSEDNEVSDIRLIPIDEIRNYKWAFGHDRRISEAMAYYLTNSIGIEI